MSLNDGANLRMVHRLAAMPPQRNLPDGFRLRSAGPGDGEEIARVLTLAFQETWDVERVNAEVLDNPNVPTTFVVETKGRLVATASYQTKADDEFASNSWLHWVGADPSLPGKGLGYIVSREVLREAWRRADEEVRLLTQDHRLAAIKTYLKLNFEPDYYHESHAARWAAVLSQIAAASPG
jgi:mycothiol synthase